MLPDQRKCAQSHLRCAGAHADLQGFCGAALNDGTKVTADMDMRLIALLGNFYSFGLFPPLNCTFMLRTCRTLRHQKLTKTLEKDIAKSLTNII